MPQSLALFTAAMKEVYAPGLRNAVNDKASPVWAEAIKNEEDVSGNEIVWSVHASRSASTGARGELAPLPTADRQRYLKARRDLTYQYHTIKVSGPAKHLTKNDTAAFGRAVETEVKGAEVDMKNDLARQVFGQALTVNGSLQTGVIATLSADPGVGTLVTLGAEDESIIRHFFSGMRISFINPATGLARTEPTGGYEVVSPINKSARTITIATAADAGIASGDFIVRNGNLDAELDGLRYIVSPTGTYAGIDPAVNPSWSSLAVGSTTTGVSETVFEEAVEVVETDGNGSSPDLVVCEHLQRRKLASLLQAQKRYDGKDTTLTSGWKGLALARGTLVADRYCPSTKAFAIHRPDLNKFIGLDFQWDEDDGEVFYKALDNSDAVEARFKGYVQLGAMIRNSHAVITLSNPTF